MKLTSRYFDSIRIIKDRKKANLPPCSWEGCPNFGEYKAPGNQGKTHRLFCLDHIKQYNKNYNYFKEGGSGSLHGEERPTWPLGQRASMGRLAHLLAGEASRFSFVSSAKGPSPPPHARPPLPQERRALETLGLDEEAMGPEIKARYKHLVKQFHPDTNGGRRDLEDQFREIIRAYDYLKNRHYRGL